MAAKKGILTEKNTLIVDNLKKPKKLYGVSDGFGSFKNISLKTFINLKNKVIKN